MFIHFANCPVWSISVPPGRCTCPRVWRIRKDRTPAGARERHYCWVIHRRIDDGSYVATIRLPSQDKAISVVDALGTVVTRYARWSETSGRSAA